MVHGLSVFNIQSIILCVRVLLCYCVPTVDRIRYNTSGFFNDTVEFERGYRCDAANDFQLKNLTEPRITAKLSVRDFHVQAFQFKTAGEFGNGEITLSPSHISLSLSLSLSLSFSLSLILTVTLNILVLIGGLYTSFHYYNYILHCTMGCLLIFQLVVVYKTVVMETRLCLLLLE